MTQESHRLHFWRARFVPAITLAAALSLNFGASAADDPLKAVFQKMDDAAPKFKGLTADMKYLSHESVIDEDDRNTGTITVRTPKPRDIHILIDFKNPAKTVEISGSNVRMFLPNAMEVQTYDISKGHRAEFEQFARLQFGTTSKDLLSSYTVTLGGPEKIEGQNATRIELVPKSHDLATQFPKIELWISDDLGISLQQKLYMQGGKDYSVATYSNVKLRSNIPDSAVKLTLPKGVTERRISR
jgi:outer membrane lipoprotein-sorting protein